MKIVEENYISCKELKKFIKEHPSFKPNGDFQEVVSDLLLLCDSTITESFTTKVEKIRRKENATNDARRKRS